MKRRRCSTCPRGTKHGQCSYCQRGLNIWGRKIGPLQKRGPKPQSRDLTEAEIEATFRAAKAVIRSTRSADV